jgi:hypothetical protein
MLHCHVNQHSDTGVAALLEVAADPNAQGPLDEPTFLRLGSCPAVRFNFDCFRLKFDKPNTFIICESKSCDTNTAQRSFAALS